MTQIEAVISDFGGVLTSPLIDSFLAFETESGVSPEALGKAMMAVARRDGANPLFELELGRITEARFLSSLSNELSSQLNRPVELGSFGQRYFENLHPNRAMIALMRQLRERDFKMAICTNNVREWEPLWRAKLPVEEIFDVVVDSAFVGSRKPERRIYELTLERLDVAAQNALLIDDLEVNCQAASELGMTTVHFRTNKQAIEDIESALGSDVAS